MGWFGALRNFFAFPSSGQYDEEDGDYADESYVGYAHDEYEEEPSAGRRKRRRGIVVKLPSVRGSKCIYTMQPQSHEEAAIAVEYLKAGSAVFINLQALKPALGQRLVDVVSGACAALDGQPRMVGERLFLFVPPDFSVASDEQTHPVEETLFMPGFHESGASRGAAAESADGGDGRIGFMSGSRF